MNLEWKRDKVKPGPLWEHSSLFGYDWLRGRYFLPELAAWGKKSAGIVVDIGCGAKPYSSFFLSSASCYIGVDLPGPHSCADVYANACCLPFCDGAVDVCFNAWLLDDLPKPERLFAEISRVLKIGGLSIMIENLSYPEHDGPFDYFRFTQYGLCHLAETDGLTVRKVLPLGGFWAQIGLQIVAFFLRGASGRVGNFVRILNPIANSIFYFLDRANYVSRGTSGYLVVFEKPSCSSEQKGKHV